MIRFLARSAAAFAVALAVGQPALAQEATPVPAPERTQPEEIIITATKREANIQEVPIAVSAFQADDLAARGIAEIDDLEQVSPSLFVSTSNTSSAGGTIRIRGIGTTGNNPGLEAAVGMFVDGVYRSRSGQGLTDLLDIERVEVLRGPQGTLFGKNTSAGAVNVITKAPNLSDMEGWAAAELGNLDHKKLSASFSVPIIEEVLAFRGSATWTDRDGYYEDIHNKNEYVNRDRYTLRGQLLWAPTDSFDARFIAEWGEKDESCCPAQYTVAGPSSNRIAPPGADELAGLLGLGLDIPNIDCTVPGACSAGTYAFVEIPRSRLKQREVGVNHEPFENIEEWGVSLEMNYDFEWAKATSITAYRSFVANYAQDIDFGSADILNPQQGAQDDFENFSEELRLAGTAFDHLDWLVGAYIYTEDVRVHERLEFGSQTDLFVFGANLGALPLGAGYEAQWKTDTTGYAFFTNNTWRALFLENLDLTLGVRWSRDEKDAEGRINDAPLAVQNGNLTNNYVVGLPVPVGTNDPFSGIVPGGGPGLGWCEDLSAAGLGAVRNILRGFCDNGSWTNGAVEKEWTGTVSLAYHWTEDLTTYFTYSRGYKTGGFNLDQESVDVYVSNAGLVDPTNSACPTLCDGGTAINDESRFKPEFANSYEAGVKSEFFDGVLRTNMAAFYTVFEDFQLNTFNGLGFTVSNVDEVKARGFELESFIMPTDGVVITLGTTYAKATYGDDIGLTFPHNSPTGSPSTIFVADGKQITNAPLWSATLSFLGEHQLPNTEWMGRLSANANYRGKHNTGSNLHPLKIEKGLWFLNMEVGVVSPEGNWEFSVWSNNLTNTFEKVVVFDSVFQGGSYGTFFNPPRTWGATLQYNFF